MTSQRPPRWRRLPVMLATSLAVGIAATAAGCQSSSHAAAPAATSAAPSATASAAPSPVTHPSASARSAQLAAIVSCLKAHGMTISSSATGKEVRSAYEGLPPAQQLSDFKACGSLLPAHLRRKIQTLINEREAATPTATATVAP